MILLILLFLVICILLSVIRLFQV